MMVLVGFPHWFLQKKVETILVTGIKVALTFWVVGTEIWSSHAASRPFVQTQASQRHEKPQGLLNVVQMTFTGPLLMDPY